MSTRRLEAFIVVTTLTAALLLAMVVPAHAQEPPKVDPWGPLRFMLGEWTGTAEGQPGKGTSVRTYTFAITGRYIHERNISTYSPPDANKAGEVHEHWGLFSYDRTRKQLVLRQFHQEGFINQYVLDATYGEGGRRVFVSERFENFDNAWKARESYDVVSPNEFVETFELAEPGKAFDVYSKTRFKRSPTSAQATRPAALEPLDFLLGTWEAAGEGQPGTGTGKAVFSRDLQDRVMVRRSFADYPASARGPASRHDDSMVIYATAAGGIRADYYDNEGHVIHYVVSSAAPGSAVFVSDIVAGEPRYRLSYTRGQNGLVKGEFAIAAPGKADTFQTYLSWESRRTDK